MSSKASFLVKAVKRVTIVSELRLCIIPVGEEMREGLELLTGRGAMLACNLATTRYNTVFILDHFQLSDPNLLTMLGRTRVSS